MILALAGPSYKLSFAYKGRIFGSGPFGTMRYGLICTNPSAPSIEPPQDDNTYGSVRPIVVRLDMLKVARVLERGHGPVELAHPAVEVRVPISDGTDVAFEVADVHRVEADLDIVFHVRLRGQDESARWDVRW